MNYNPIDKNDLQSYKTILEITNGHLEGYKAGVGVGGGQHSGFSRNEVQRRYREIISRG